jgi:UDP-N-acetylglucosamine:LPS N-acetylglucosamine transferase
LRDGWARDQRHWVTFNTSDARSLLAGEGVTYAAYPTNRNLPNFVRNLFLAVRIIRALRPKAIVTTGAGVAVPFCWVARLAGARVVYIESFARIESPSLTGRLIHPVATDFFVQWPKIVRYFRKAQYKGALF